MARFIGVCTPTLMLHLEMDQRAAVTEVIFKAIREYNEQVPAHRRIPEAPETILFGRQGSLDSLGLVNLILLVEEHLNNDYRVAITLADERAMSQERSPFRDVQSLAGYICSLLPDSTYG